MTPTQISPQAPRTFTAFEDHRKLASGALADVAVAVKTRSDAAAAGTLLVFDDRNARVVDLDLRGSAEDVVAGLPRLEAFLFRDPAKTAAPAPKKRGRGRPKLGVVGKEVTLLPRHWEWLDRQPGGASVTLRKLVEAARRAGGGAERQRSARDAAYRFMSAMAGNLPGFEEAARALFAGDRAKLLAASSAWHGDVRSYTLRLAADGLESSPSSPDNDDHA